MVEIIEEISIEKGKNFDTEYITYKCPICKWKLMKIRNYPGGSAVDWRDDCEHFEWYTTRCSPYDIDERDFWCRLEKEMIQKLKKKAVIIESDNSTYYYLIPIEKPTEDE